MSAERDFTKGPVVSNMIKFALPVLGASLLQSAYGAADLLIVGHFGDSASVSAVGSGSEIMYLVTFIIFGLTMGATVLIGQRIGSKDFSGAGAAVGAACALFIVVGILLTGLMELIAYPMCKLMQVPKEAMEKALVYVRICSAGVVFITAYNVISGIFRGIGNSKLPMIFVAISAAANVIGDLVLCGIFRLDSAGAAIATIAAQALSVVLSLVIISRQDLPFSLKKRDISLKTKDVGTILKLGVPLSLQDALVHFSFIAIFAFANTFGLAASAGYSVASRLSGFMMLIPSAVGASVTAVVSQNVGAGLYSRAKNALFKMIAIGTGFGIVVCVLSFLFAPQLSSVFTSDKAVIDQSSLNIYGFCWDGILTNTLFAFSGFYNGHGKTTAVMLNGITSAILIRLPLTWFFSVQSWGSLFWLGIATPISTVYGIIFYLVYYRSLKKKEPRLMG